MEHIRIKPHFSIITHNPDMVELRHGVWNSESHMLQDESEKGILARIMLSLNQQTSLSEMAKTLDIKRSTIESVLDYLQQLGVLQSSATSFVDYYIDRIPTMRRNHQFNLQKLVPLVLVGDDCMNQKIYQQLVTLSQMQGLTLDIEAHSNAWSLIQQSGDHWLFDALEQERFVAQFKAWQDKLIIFTSKHINPVLATRLNRIAYEWNITWMHLALDGPFILIGPTFYGRQGPCYDCFESRVSMNLRETERYQKYKNAIVENQVFIKEKDPLFEVTSSILVSHAVLEILNYITTQANFTSNKVLSIFLPTMEFVYHELIRLPACRTCGSVSYRDNTQLYFDFQKLVNEEEVA